MNKEEQVEAISKISDFNYMLLRGLCKTADNYEEVKNKIIENNKKAIREILNLNK